MTEARLVVSAVDATKAAFASVQQGLQGLKGSVGTVTTALGALGATAFAAKMVGDVRSVIEQWDELGKSAQRAGFASAQGMAEFQFAARLAGVDGGEFEKAMGQLAQKMAEAAGGSKDAAALFAALGISVKDANGNLKSTEAAVSEIANAFSRWSDGPEKTALAKEMGKAWQGLIPLLNGGAAGLDGLREEFRSLRGELSGGTVKQAEQFNDNLFKLETASGALGRSLANNLLPSLVRVTDQMVQAVKEGGSLSAVIAGLRTAMTGDDRHKANVDMVDASNSILNIQNLIDRTRSGEVAPTIDGRSTSVDKAVERLQKQLGEQRAKFERARGYANLLDNGLSGPPAPDESKSTAPVIKKPQDDKETLFDSINKKVKERVAEQELELKQGFALTDQQKFRVKIEADIVAAKQKITPEQQRQLRLEMDASDAAAQKLLLLKNELSFNKAFAQEMVRDTDELAQAEARRNTERGRVAKQNSDEAEALKDQNDALKLEAQLIGATEQERAVRNEQMRIELDLQKKLREYRDNPLLDQAARDRQGAEARANAETAKRQVAFRADIDLSRQFGDEIRGDLRGGLMAGFNDSRGFVAGFADSLGQAIQQRVSGALADSLLNMAGIGSKSSMGIDGLFLGLRRAIGGYTPGGSAASNMADNIDVGGGWSPNANGGVYASPSLSAYSGQVVDRPTMFRFAMGMGLMGEAGPEAILPLRRGKDGRLGVQTAGGGVQITFAPQISVDSRSDRGAVLADVGRILRQNNEQLYAELRNQRVVA